MLTVSAHLAIIPPKPEVSVLADSVVSREGPIHVAAMIALVALFIVTWVLLSEGPAKSAKESQARPT